MQWVVDAGVVTILASVVPGGGTLSPGTLFISEAVAAECQTGNSNNLRDRLLAAAVGGVPVLEVVPIPLMSAASQYLYQELRPQARKSTADFGEHESIAICDALMPAARFVTMDKMALMLAAAELGTERIATPFELWQALRNTGGLSQTQYEDACQRTARQMQPMRVPRRFR